MCPRCSDPIAHPPTRSLPWSLHNRKSRRAAGRGFQPALELLEGRWMPAANRIWLGDVNNTNWSLDANWKDNLNQPGRPQAGDQLLFPAAAAGFLSNNDLPAGLTLGSIRVEGSGYSITGNAIKLSNGSDALIAPGTTGFNQLSLGIELLSTPAVVSCANTLRLSGVISGQSLEKRGAGVLELSGANTYNLGTTIDAGTLRLMANERIRDGSAVTIDAGAVLDVNGFSEHIGTLSGAGTIQLDNGHLFAGGSTLSFFPGTIQGPGDFSKDGAGSLILSAVNGLAASTLGVDAGMLTLGNDNVIADNVRVLVFGGAILNLNGRSDRIGSLEGGGGVWLGGGQLFAGGSGASTTFSGAIAAKRQLHQGRGRRPHPVGRQHLQRRDPGCRGRARARQLRCKQHDAAGALDHWRWQRQRRQRRGELGGGPSNPRQRGAYGEP